MLLARYMTSNSIWILISYTWQTANVLLVPSPYFFYFHHSLRSDSGTSKEPRSDGLGFQLGDLATPLWVFTVFDSVLFVFSQLMSPEAGELVGFGGDLVVGLLVSHSGQGDRSDGESRGIVES